MPMSETVAYNDIENVVTFGTFNLESWKWMPILETITDRAQWTKLSDLNKTSCIVIVASSSSV